MNGVTLRRNVVIRNPYGFHMRPAAAFAETAGRFQSEVILINGDRRVDGRRILELMMLGADEGSEVVLEVSGPDADAAVEALVEILSAAEPPEPPASMKS